MKPQYKIKSIQTLSTSAKHIVPIVGDNKDPWHLDMLQRPGSSLIAVRLVITSKDSSFIFFVKII